jgi:hypothetical protein
MDLLIDISAHIRSNEARGFVRVAKASGCFVRHIHTDTGHRVLCDVGCQSADSGTVLSDAGYASMFSVNYPSV